MSGRALVTGAAGFVGTTLCAYLEERGWEVVRGVLPGQTGGLPCDITNPKLLHECFEAAGPLTHIFHLAAIAFVPAANKNPALAIDVNLSGTIHLSEIAREHTPGARFIYVGSSDAYGTPLSLPISEAHPLNPINIYAISKAAADHYCSYLHRAHGMDVVRMRPFNHSGPRQEPAFFLPSCAKQIAEIEAGLKPPVMQVGNLLASRDFSHVHDVVRAFEAAALRGGAGEAYNVCMGRSYTMREALDAMLRRAKVEIATELDPARLRPSELPGIVGANNKLRAETGWAPEKSFDDLMDDLMNYWRRRVLTELGGK